MASHLRPTTLNLSQIIRRPQSCAAAATSTSKSTTTRNTSGPAKCFTRPYAVASHSAIPASKARFIPSSGTYPQGFRISSAHAGVKPSNNVDPSNSNSNGNGNGSHNKQLHDDIAVLVSDRPAAAAATFTTNKFQAAPVVVSREVLAAAAAGGIRGVVINSGCANAVTGKGGLVDARAMAAEVDRLLGIESGSSAASSPSSAGGEAKAAVGETLVMSTGVIGQKLPMAKILHAIPAAFASVGSTHDHWMRAARAICTTDTFPKLLSRTFTLPGADGIEYRIAGITKGAGMIHPNMATLLGLICTDAPIAPAALSPLLKQAVDQSFNAISIDGDTSTNDTVALLANGAAGGPLIDSPHSSSSSSSPSPAYAALASELVRFAQDLSQLVVRDGEGATKFVRSQRRESARTRGRRETHRRHHRHARRSSRRPSTAKTRTGAGSCARSGMRRAWRRAALCRSRRAYRLCRWMARPS